MITDEMVETGARGMARPAGWPTDHTPGAERVRQSYRDSARRVLNAVLLDRSELSVHPATPYRLSPAGVLVWRDLRREPGWMGPHWTVIHKPAGDRSHYVGQHLPDQAVAGWSPLVRRGAS